MGAGGGEGGGGLRNNKRSRQASWKSAVQYHGSSFRKQIVNAQRIWYTLEAQGLLEEDSAVSGVRGAGLVAAG